MADTLLFSMQNYYLEFGCAIIFIHLTLKTIFMGATDDLMRSVLPYISKNVLLFREIYLEFK